MPRKVLIISQQLGNGGFGIVDYRLNICVTDVILIVVFVVEIKQPGRARGSSTDLVRVKASDHEMRGF